MQTLYDLLASDLIEAKKLQESLVSERYRDFGPAEVSLMLHSAGHVGGDLVGMFPISVLAFMALISRAMESALR